MAQASVIFAMLAVLSLMALAGNAAFERAGASSASEMVWPEGLPGDFAITYDWSLDKPGFFADRLAEVRRDEERGLAQHRGGHRRDLEDEERGLEEEEERQEG